MFRVTKPFSKHILEYNKNLNHYALIKPFTIFIIYLSLSIFITYPLISHFTDSIIALTKNNLPAGDSAVFLWNFWWFKKAFVELKTSPLFTHYQAHPIGTTLIYSTLSEFNSALSIPLQYFLPLTAIYNIFIIISLTLTGFFTYLLVKYITKSHLSGFISGLIFSFTLYHQAHYSHLNLLSTEWIPLTILFVLKTSETKKIGYAVLSAIFFVINALSCWYYFIFLIIFLCLFLFYKITRLRSEQFKQIEKKLIPLYIVLGIILFILMQFTIEFLFAFISLVFIYCLFVLYTVRKTTNLNKDIINITIFIFIILLLLSPYITEYYKQTKQEDILEAMPFASKIFYSAEPLTYFFHKSPFRLNEENFYRLRTDGEFSLFLGYTTIILFVIALIKGKKGKFWLFPLIIFYILSLGPSLKFNGIIKSQFIPNKIIFLPGLLISSLPVFEGIRVFARFGIMTIFSVAVFIGINFHSIFWNKIAGGDSQKSVGADPRVCPSEKNGMNTGVRPYKNIYQNLRYLLIGLIMILILVEKLKIPTHPEKIIAPSIYEEIAKDKENFSVLNLPLSGNLPAYLYTQIIHNHPMLNCFVSRGSSNIEKFFNSFSFLNTINQIDITNIEKLNNPDTLKTFNNEIQTLNIKYIIIYKSDYPSIEIQKLKNLFHILLKYKYFHEDEVILILNKDP